MNVGMPINIYACNKKCVKRIKIQQRRNKTNFYYQQLDIRASIISLLRQS